MRKHRPDFLILFLTFILMAVGLLVIYTIGPVRANFLNAAYGANYSENYFIIHQVISVAIAVVAFFVFYKIFKIEKIEKFASWFLIFAFFANMLLLLGQVVKLPFVKCELGACRWLELPGMSVQPAEFLKFALVIYFAKIAAEYKKAGGLSKKKVNWRMFTQGLPEDNPGAAVVEFFKRVIKNPIGKFWVKYILVVGLALFLVVVVQKDLGSGLPIATEALAILLVAGISKKMFLGILGAVLAVGVGLILTSPHRMERVVTFLGMSSNSSVADLEDGEAEGSTAGDANSVNSVEQSADSYHIENALIAIGSGGLFGVGVGNSVQATGYLPESINDSVFAIMGETFGFLGLVLVVAGFMILLMRILRTADCLREQEMNLIAVGAFAWLMTHVVVNIAAMTGLMPLTGITLPLLSYGGTSMMCVAGMLGLVVQISQYTERKVIEDEERVVSMKDAMSAGYARRAVGVSYAQRGSSVRGGNYGQSGVSASYRSRRRRE